MKSFPRRRWIYIGLVLLIGLILFVAPQRNPRASGSTYHRAPDGYGAWFAYMQEQGHPVQRWQIPSAEITQKDSPQTFLQISPPDTNIALMRPLRPWVEEGNTWVILGYKGLPTDAPFTSSHSTDQQDLTLETTKRHSIVGNETVILGDRFGAIIWQEPVGKGRIIYSVSPFLGANAYQDEPGNFAYLETLMAQDQVPIWIDEAIHGYIDKEVTTTESTGNWGTYLARTPLLIVLVQTIVILLVMIVAQNQRLGLSEKLQPASVDNSEAYIQALAGVLEKAERSEFVLDVIGHETRLQLQRTLGLGTRKVEDEALFSAWVEQTGHSSEELSAVLNQPSSSLSRRELLDWIQKLRQIQDAAKTPI